ncbi:unnamed protein product [Withania somnifera]
MWYHVAKPSEFLVITGRGIDELKIEKKALVWPFQKCTRIDVSPVNYTFEVNAMSAENLSFLLAAVFTIGLQADDHDSLVRYARLLSPHQRNSHDVMELVQGIIEGEMRILAASMSMEDVFKVTKDFKRHVFGKVLQLVDVRGHEYFLYLGQRVQMEAANKAKVDVAEAKMKGNVGAKQSEGLTIQSAAKIDKQIGSITKSKKQKAADAILYEKEKLARSLKADAQTYAIKQAADAALYAKMKEAEGLVALAAAQGFYISTLLSALGGDYEYTKDIAKFNAEAIRDLQPKITIWSSGGASEGETTDGTRARKGNGATKEMAELYSVIRQSVVNKQTRMLPPPWLSTCNTTNKATSSESA